MGIKSLAGRLLANYVTRQTNKWASRPFDTQQKVFFDLISKGRKTRFGEDHHFGNIHNHEDFKRQVPVYDYEDLRPYIKRIKNGEKDVLWPGRPAYFAKTSGTTSGAKYIPITKDSIPNHINAARNALLHYIKDSGNTQFINGKMIFLSGSPVLEREGGTLTGRLSGIVNHHVPAYLQRNKVPTYETNCIEDWDQKLEAIIQETLNENMTLISGIPPWVQTYFDQLMAKTGKPIKDIFRELSVLVHGGVNFEPYRARLEQSIGKKIDAIETFPASEGFFAYQVSQEDEGMLLNLNSGIFYEFIPMEEVHKEAPERLTIDQVETGQHYALVISNNAGLWAYNVGDTVKFTSKAPFKVKVTGRVKHFTSAFGEHVIAEEVERAITSATGQTNAEIAEFTVAPVINPEQGLPHHEWFIEFNRYPQNMEQFREKLDEAMCAQNIYYQDLVKSGILDKLHIRLVKKDGFNDYMRSIGKLGGQNKLPRLANDRHIADGLEPHTEDMEGPNQ